MSPSHNHRRLLIASPELRAAGGIAGYVRMVLGSVAGPAEAIGFGQSSGPFALPEHCVDGGSSTSIPGFTALLGRRWLSKEPLDLLVGHLALTAPLALLPAAPRHRVTLLVHGFEGWSRVPRRRAVGLGRVDRFVFTTRYTRDLFKAYNRGLFRDDAEHHVIPLTAGAEAEGLPRVEPIPGRSQRVALCTSRLSHEEPLKGIDTLLEAMTRLPGHWSLRVVGDGDARESHVARARALGLDGRVQFLGRVDDAVKRRELDACDVFVLPSAQEGFGIVFLEALAAGRPCVGAAAGAVPEVLDDRCGALVPFADPGALAKAISTTAARVDDGTLSASKLRAVYDMRFSSVSFAHAFQALFAG